MNPVLSRLLAVSLLWLPAPAAFAHKPSDSYLNLTVSGAMVQGQWDIALRDLEHAIGLDADGDGEIKWRELQSAESRVFDYALAKLALAAGGKPCAASRSELLVDNHSDGAYAVLRFSADCGRAIGALSVDYRLLFDLDPQHRGLARIASDAGARTAIFAPDAALQTFELGERAGRTGFLQFIKQGIWHIWIGADHLLFLLTLLLPAVLIRRDARWAPVEGWREAFWDVFKVVTSFTVAHSITLSAATLELISAPSRWVETAIAVSVLLAALNNLFPVVLGRRWAVAFAFGLVHGFGFASVLLDLGLPRGDLLWSLAGFNLGVEIGQLAIISAYFPLAYLLRDTRAYRQALMAGGSAMVAAVAILWIIERSLDLKLSPL